MKTSFRGMKMSFAVTILLAASLSGCAGTKPTFELPGLFGRPEMVGVEDVASEDSETMLARYQDECEGKECRPKIASFLKPKADCSSGSS